MIPVCVLCHKFGRRCIYEKPTKTPLTRRYLNEVESELVRTKALLQQFMTNSEDGSNVDFGAPVENLGQASRSENSSGSQLLSHPEPSDRRTRPLGPPTSPDVRSRYLARQSATRETGSHQQYQYRSSIPETGPQTLSCISLESPSSPSNFEWDERNGNSNGEKFVDGMASLTSASHEGGYLGLYEFSFSSRS